MKHNSVSVIRTKKDHLKALDILQAFLHKSRKVDVNYVHALSAVIEDWEHRHYPIDPPDPIEAIKFRIDQSGLSRRQFALMAKIDPRHLGLILNRIRPLGTRAIQKLHRHHSIPLSSLVNEKLFQDQK